MTLCPVLLLAPVWPKQSWYSSRTVLLALKQFPLLQGNFHSPVVQNVQASRLDVVRDWYRGQEFSARAAGFLAQSVRPLTSLVYVKKWDIFCTWCTERRINPVSIPVGDLGDFLLFLCEDLNLAASTVRAYKVAILSALSPKQIFLIRTNF